MFGRRRRCSVRSAGTTRGRLLSCCSCAVCRRGSARARALCRSHAPVHSRAAVRPFLCSLESVMRRDSASRAQATFGLVGWHHALALAYPLLVRCVQVRPCSGSSTMPLARTSSLACSCQAVIVQPRISDEASALSPCAQATFGFGRLAPRAGACSPVARALCAGGAVLGLEHYTARTHRFTRVQPSP